MLITFLLKKKFALGGKQREKRVKRNSSCIQKSTRCRNVDRMTDIWECHLFATHSVIQARITDRCKNIGKRIISIKLSHYPTGKAYFSREQVWEETLIKSLNSVSPTMWQPGVIGLLVWYHSKHPVSGRCGLAKNVSHWI